MTTWSNARAVCKSYDLDFVSLETRAEADNFFRLCFANQRFFKDWTHIGGMSLNPLSRTEWYWVNSGNRLDYLMNFLPGEPNNDGGEEHCLAIGRSSPDSAFGFNDFKCYGINAFVCQDIKYSMHCRGCDGPGSQSKPTKNIFLKQLNV